MNAETHHTLKSFFNTCRWADLQRTVRLLANLAVIGGVVFSMVWLFKAPGTVELSHTLTDDQQKIAATAKAINAAKLDICGRIVRLKAADPGTPLGTTLQAFDDRECRATDR